MRNRTLIIIIFIILICPFSFGQSSKPKSTSRKTSTPKKLKTLILPLPKKKIEAEDWQVYTFEENNFKLEFPKKPEVQEQEFLEDDVIVKRYFYQADINDSFFLLSIAKYPEGLLPKGNDLGENFAEWLKSFVLIDETLLSEKLLDFGDYGLVEFIYWQGKNELVVHRVLVIDDSLYQFILHFETLKDENYSQAYKRNEEKISKFLYSFVLTKPIRENINTN